MTMLKPVWSKMSLASLEGFVKRGNKHAKVELLRRSKGPRKYQLVDLAFNPKEPRLPDGKWTGNPMSRALAAIKKADRIEMQKRIDRITTAKTFKDAQTAYFEASTAHGEPGDMKRIEDASHAADKRLTEAYGRRRPLPKPPKGAKVGKPGDPMVHINDKDMPVSEAVPIVGDAFSWAEMDGEGGGDPDSVFTQHEAQVLGQAWNASVGGGAPDADQYAASLWDQYQDPNHYGVINAALRTGTAPEGSGASMTPESLRGYADLMFKEGGFTIPKPMTVYRALKSARKDKTEPGDDSITNKDWAEILKPGTTFSDKGIISTTAHEKFSEGWLMGDAEGNNNRTVETDDVIMEIHVPAGTRVLGGSPQFIETMLHPGSQFKIKSNDVYTVKGAIDPLDHTVSNMKAHRVVAEMIP